MWNSDRGIQKVIALDKQKLDSGFDDNGFLVGWRSQRDQQLPDYTKDFSDSLTPGQIVEAIQADEHLPLFVHDPHHELPNDYYLRRTKTRIEIELLNCSRAVKIVAPNCRNQRFNPSEQLATFLRKPRGEISYLSKHDKDKVVR